MSSKEKSKKTLNVSLLAKHPDNLSDFVIHYPKLNKIDEVSSPTLEQLMQPIYDVSEDLKCKLMVIELCFFHFLPDKLRLKSWDFERKESQPPANKKPVPVEAEVIRGFNFYQYPIQRLKGKPVKENGFVRSTLSFYQGTEFETILPFLAHVTLQYRATALLMYISRSVSRHDSTAEFAEHKRQLE